MQTIKFAVLWVWFFLYLLDQFFPSKFNWVTLQWMPPLPSVLGKWKMCSNSVPFDGTLHYILSLARKLDQPFYLLAMCPLQEHKSKHEHPCTVHYSQKVTVRRLFDTSVWTASTRGDQEQHQSITLATEVTLINWLMCTIKLICSTKWWWPCPYCFSPFDIVKVFH